MITVVLVLTFILGFFLQLRLFGNRLNVAEFLGLAFPLGLFQVVMGMCLLDMVHVPLTRPVVTGFIVLAMLVWGYLLFRQKFQVKVLSDIFSWRNILGSVNLVWLLFLGFIVYYEWMNFGKCMFFPTFDRDSLTSFDTQGFLMGMEHTISRISLFNEDINPSVHNPGSSISYMPFVQVAYAFVYLFGAETSKFIPAMLFLSFLIAFYGLVKRAVGGTGAMVATFFTLMAPEMISFSNMSGINVIQAVFASLGLIYGVLWLRDSQKAETWTYLLLSALLLGANCMIRNEGVVFPAAVGVWAIIKLVRKKLSWKEFLGWAGITGIPFIVWKIFQKVAGLTTASFVEMPPFVDGEKMQVIVKSIYQLLLTQNYYGWTFIALGLAALVGIYFLIRRKARFDVLWVSLGALAFYVLILYHVDYVWDSLSNVLAYSAKRYMFCFVPLAWYFTVTVYPIGKFFQVADEKMSFFSNKGQVKASKKQVKSSQR